MTLFGDAASWVHLVTSGMTVVHFVIRCCHLGSSGWLCVYLHVDLPSSQNSEASIREGHYSILPWHKMVLDAVAQTCRQQQCDSEADSHEAHLAPEKRVAEKPLRPGFLCTICTGRSKIMSTRISPSVMRGRNRWLIS